MNFGRAFEAADALRFGEPPSGARVTHPQQSHLGEDHCIRQSMGQYTVSYGFAAKEAQIIS